MFDEIIQQQYYDETASTYDNNCGHSPEHEFALYLLLGFLESIKAESVLDVGCGTGRGLAFLKQHRPNMILRGCEPVKALRDVAIENGIQATA
jgi:SAM-dependent methyltransferase